MEHKTLDELKRENAEAEAVAPEAESNADETEVDVEANQEIKEENLDDDSEQDETEDEQPAWMTGEDSDSQSQERLFTGSDIAAAKRKLKGRLEEKSTEVEQLKQQVEQLQKSLQTGSQAQQSRALQKPTREQFLNADDPDEAYVDALTEWKISTKVAQSQQYMRQQQRQQAVNDAQNRHYSAAEKLINEHGISEDVYRQADTQFKRGLDAVRPGAGELIATELIAQMGEGSEKVTFMLGRNPQKMAQLQQALVEDPNGIKASILLGKMQAETNLGGGKKATRKTPPPAKRIQGDASGSSDTASAKKLKKAYQQAHSKRDAQAAFDARRAAKKAGVDVSDW